GPPPLTQNLAAATAGPTGGAQTVMAAAALDVDARKRGDWIKVETRGSVGAETTLPAEERAAAAGVRVAAGRGVGLSGV
ncbi:hypothetical protein C9F04_11950, partial [Salmonella enterica subsp. enterica serovar Wilhelmsburg]